MGPGSQAWKTPEEKASGARHIQATGEGYHFLLQGCSQTKYQTYVLCVSLSPNT